jgi:adenosylcobinamide-GDP ribazoletransferase
MSEPPKGIVGEQLRVFLTAVMFLTRLPCPSWVGHEPEYLAKSSVYFPLVGIIVGAIGAIAWLLTGWIATPLLAAIVATAATIWATGAFHEDGLADSFDGIGGGWTRDQMLEIMKDSRIGTYGMVALLLVIIAKLHAIASLGSWKAAAAIVAAHAIGRCSSLPLIYWLPYVQHSGSKSKPFAASVDRSMLSIACVATSIGTLLLLSISGLIVLVIAILVTLLGGLYLRRVLGGITGDTLGCVNQLCELSVYVTLAIIGNRL